MLPQLSATIREALRAFLLAAASVGNPVDMLASASPEHYEKATRLNALTDQMNKATGQAKVDAMARLLTALVEHRSMMMQEMKMMQDDLDAEHEAMQHMRQMMGRGMTNAPPGDIKK